jgi:hypothetical protein
MATQRKDTEGVNVFDLMVGESTTTIDWNNQKIGVTYNPNEYTPEVEAGWAEMEKNGWMAPVLTDFVCRLVTSWDIKGRWDDEAGKFKVSDEMFPIVEGQVRHLPMQFLASVVNAITEDSQPGR